MVSFFQELHCFLYNYEKKKEGNMPPLHPDSGFTRFPNTLRFAPWLTRPKTVSLYFHLRMNASHFPREIDGVSLRPGELITGRKALSRETGLTEDEVRTALRHLRTSGHILASPRRRYTLVSFPDWLSAPESSPAASPADSPPQPRQSPTYKERNTENKEKKGGEAGTRASRSAQSIPDAADYLCGTDESGFGWI